MSARSSIATRAVACLVVVLVLGSGTVGVATAATGGSTSSETTNGPLGELTGTTAAVLETTVDGTTDTLEKTTNETTTELENATNETTGALENVTKGTTDVVDGTVDETTDTLEKTTNETTMELENTSDETNVLLENVTERVTAPIEVRGGVGVEGDGSNVTIGTELEVAAASNEDGAAEEDSNGADDDEGAGPAPPSGGSSGADAVLVGLLGAITASGAAAGSAGASAGAGAGAGAGGAAAGSAAGLVGSWLSQLSQLPGMRHLSRAGSVLPWKLLPIFKYSRYDDSDPLENDRRRAVYETIAADPGCYLSQVSDRSEVALSTVRHHVRVLEEEGLVTSAKLNGKRRYYLDADGDQEGDGIDVADAELHAALAEPAKRGVLETLADLGSAPNGRLADELERDPSTVSHHLSALEDDGLVVREKDGRAMVNELAPDVEATLREESTPSEEEPAEPPLSAPADD